MARAVDSLIANVNRSSYCSFPTQYTGLVRLHRRPIESAQNPLTSDDTLAIVTLEGRPT